MIRQKSNSKQVWVIGSRTCQAFKSITEAAAFLNKSLSLPVTECQVESAIRFKSQFCGFRISHMQPQPIDMPRMALLKIEPILMGIPGINA